MSIFIVIDLEIEQNTEMIGKIDGVINEGKLDYICENKIEDDTTNMC